METCVDDYCSLSVVESTGSGRMVTVHLKCTECGATAEYDIYAEDVQWKE